MLKNYIIIALRNFYKHKIVSAINLSGLIIGLSCCFLILAFVSSELSYDKYNKNADRVYRVTRTFYNPNGSASLKLSSIAPAFGPYLTSDFSDIEKITRLYNSGNSVIRYRDNIYNEKKIYFADENLFDVFTLRILSGNDSKSLSEPYSALISEKLSKKYFQTENPINKIIRVNNDVDIKIAGVYQDFPVNSHIHPEMLISFNTLNDPLLFGKENLKTNWENNAFFTYLLMPANYPVKSLVSKFPAFINRHLPRQDYNGVDQSKFTSLDLQKMTDTHLYSTTDYDAEKNNSISYVYFFSIIGLFILLIAGINYTNLSIARSTIRAKEIGIRKVVGSKRIQLIIQFLIESILTSYIAWIMALIIAIFCFSWLNKISNETINFSSLLQWHIILLCILMPLLTGILAGSYPAFFMAAIKPVNILKGQLLIGKGVGIRKILVIIQFTISIVLITLTMIVFQQLNFLQEKSLGFDQQKIILLPYNNEVDKEYETLKSTILNNHFFEAVTRSSRIPSGRLLDYMPAYTMANDSLLPVATNIKYVGIDYDFFEVYDIPFLFGRDFSRQFSTDTLNFILNESAIKAIGFKNAETAIGKPLKYGDQTGRIIGVTKDFNFESLKQQIEPIIFTILPKSQAYFYKVSVKFNNGNIASGIEYLKNIWKKILPETPYDTGFVDERINSLYKDEQRQSFFFVLFTFIAIFIANLGLIGLSSFIIAQRLKEISIRRVLGATIQDVLILIFKNFLITITISALISFFISWYFANKWLANFAFHIQIRWWVFVLSSLLALLIAFITVSFQTLRAIKSNPVANMKS